MPRPEAVSPYRTIATLTIPVQDAYPPLRRRSFNEVAAFRHEATGTVEKEPANPSRITA